MKQAERYLNEGTHPRVLVEVRGTVYPVLLGRAHVACHGLVPCVPTYPAHASSNGSIMVGRAAPEAESLEEKKKERQRRNQ